MRIRDSYGKMVAKCTLSIHFLICCSISNAVGAPLRPDYYTGNDAGISYPDRMSNLTDDMSLANLSIPGTHHTMTFRGHGGPLAQCQSWNLDTQLDAGIRFLDIRCRHFYDVLTIHNGVYYQHAIFIGVLRTVTSFLRRHPHEAVLMRVKKEHTEYGDRSMEELFREAIGMFDSKFFWTINSMPNLGEARGKIVFLDDFADGRVGVKYSDAEIADDWEVPVLLPKELDAKWESVKNNVNEASEDRSNRMFLTYTSGSSNRVFAYAVADQINPKLFEFIINNPDRKKWGTVVMDFPGGPLVEKIILSNNFLIEDNTTEDQII
ncbi:1-phosphatidylinositol phosphodiesterase-like [Ptychodera flava]|uniref:1-phosphatidylinositol phosphodiesterase-like n=1 Tax=Ptychodera flava TaxID=63121 RepID=UPI00396A7C6B